MAVTFPPDKPSDPPTIGVVGRSAALRIINLNPFNISSKPKPHRKR